LVHTCLMYLVLSLAGPAAEADPVQEVVNKVSTGHYRIYQIIFENMGLGFYGGPAYNQGYRNRDGWAYAATLGNREARLFLVDQFSSMGLQVSEQGAYANVVADWPGTETPEKIYIVCAHYDTCNGSGLAGGDDNASGMAGLIEAARVLTQSHFKSTLRFIAFNAEEDEEKGSQDYVNALPWDTDIAGVINLDMILRPGWDTDPCALIDLEVETEYLPYCAAWVESFVRAAALYVPSLVIDPNSHYPAVWDWGDQGPFLAAGYAAFTAIENSADDMWEGGSNFYGHSNQDASDALANDPLGPSGVTYDYEFAANVVKAAVATLALEAVLVPPNDLNLDAPQLPWQN